MRLFLLFVVLPLLPTGTYANSLNASAFHRQNTSPSFTIGTPICVDPPRARGMDLERIDYRDCIPLLNEILLEPNIDRRNQYNSKTDYQGHLLRTCSTALLPRFAEASDVFWGYQIAIAAATAIKNCVEDSADQYGGIVFTTSRRLFYMQVKSVGEGGAGGITSLPISVESGFAENLLLPAVNNNTNATLITPNPTSAIPACQISKPLTHHLFPVRILDCYYLFYNILTNPTVEQPVKLRGLSPIRFERYGTCSLQLRGHSAVSADTITYVALLLGAVAIVQKCVVESGFVLAGAVGVGSRGQYFLRVFNPGDAEMGERVRSE